jgi:hypothetical protein
LAIDEKARDEDHINTAICYNNLGLVAHEIEDNNDAAYMHGEALVRREKVLAEPTIQVLPNRTIILV